MSNPIKNAREIGITLKPHEVRGFLDGRQTQLRRVVRLPGLAAESKAWGSQARRPAGYAHAAVRTCYSGGFEWHWPQSNSPHTVPITCPFGAAGDTLWVRETHLPDPSADDVAWDSWRMSYYEWDGCGRKIRDIPRALQTASNILYRADPKWESANISWSPSTQMPRWASRLSLRVKNVRAERVQDIDDEGAAAEGMEYPVCHTCHGTGTHPYGDVCSCDGGYRMDNEYELTTQFRTHWESIHGPGSWDRNDWVWVVEMEVANEQ